MSSEIIVPLLPLFVIIVLGESYLVLGIIDSIAESTVSFVKMLSGYASDRFGRRKRFVAFGYGFSALMKTGLPFAAAWPHVFAVRVGDRVGKGVRDPPRDALIAESTGPDTMGKAFGFHRTMDTTGAILGPLLVLILFPTFAAMSSTEQAFRDLFLLAVLPAALAFFVILAVRELAAPPKVTLRLRVSLRVLPVRLRLFVIVASLYSLANFTLFIPIAFVSDLGEALAGLTPQASLTLAVSYYLLFNVVYALLAVYAGAWSDRIGRKPVILIGYSAFVAGSLGFALVRNPFLLLPSFLLYGISYAFVEGTQRALVADLAPRELKATSLGTYHAAVGVAKLPASILAGALATFISPAVAFLAAAAIAIVAGTLFVGTFAEARRPVTGRPGPRR